MAISPFYLNGQIFHPLYLDPAPRWSACFLLELTWPTLGSTSVAYFPVNWRVKKSLPVGLFEKVTVKTNIGPRLALEGSIKDDLEHTNFNQLLLYFNSATQDELLFIRLRSLGHRRGRHRRFALRRSG